MIQIIPYLLSVGELGSLLPGQGQGVVSLVPLTEGGGIDDDDGVLDEGLCPDQLVVTGVVDNIDDPGLASGSLGSPREVTGVQPGFVVLS